MADVKLRLGRTVWFFLLSSAVACLVSGAALAACVPTLPITAGSVPCYITVQPIDVGTPVNGSPVYAPFNTTSQTGNPSTAGMPSNPIGFFVDPATGLFAGQSNYSGAGVDVTRALLNNVGVDLVWLPMRTYVTPGPNGQNPSQNFTTLNITPVSTGTTVASNCSGFISNTTLTITSPCGTGTLAVNDFLTAGTAIAQNTFISALGTGSGGVGTYTVNIPQTVGTSRKPNTTIAATSGTLGSLDFLTLSDQPNLSKGILPSTSTTTPAPPLSSDPTTINLFFVNKLNPPAAGGTLYGFAHICNNGVAIGGNTFFAPTPLQTRPDTIAHELLHNLCLDHTSYGAGPYTPPNNETSYAAPAGVVPPIPLKPLAGQCDPGYPACAANLMTAGNLRTEPTLSCVLSGYSGAPVPASCNGSPSLVNGMADRVTNALTPDQTSTLPVSQQRGVLNGGSGLLFAPQPPPPPIFAPTLGGLINPIPYETTKAQLDTGGSSSDRVIFDLSGPVEGKPGETLVGWTLTLPEGHTFGPHSRFDIISQSREDLVQEVNYYPHTDNNPPMRKIVYQPGAENTSDNPSIGTAGPSPCAFEAAECLIVKFQAPGLGAYDSISFSKSILSGDPRITNDDLCKAKITYAFSDGFVTTSNFGRCRPGSLPLIASSWHPDPQLAPQIVKTNVLLAAAVIDLPCTPVLSGETLVCPDPTLTSVADADPTQEGGQLGQSCDGGATVGSINVSGTIKGPNVTVNAGQQFNYTSCEFLGSLTINGGNVYLQNCQVDGNLTMTSGTLNLSTSAHVKGNVQISQGSGVSLLPNGFSIGPSAQIDGNLSIQNLPANEPGSVCGTQISGGLTAKNNLSSIEIGATAAQQNCPGNSIAGGLECKGNAALTGGGNMVLGSISPQCAPFVQ